MKIVMVSGHFDPLHDIHLEYFRQAMNWGAFLLVVVASDGQVIAKKGKVNIPEAKRLWIADLVLKGLGIKHQTIINHLDRDGTVTDSLRWWRPDVFFRGNDKSPDKFPEQEAKACEDCGIRVVYARFAGERHSSEMM